VNVETGEPEAVGVAEASTDEALEAADEAAEAAAEDAAEAADEAAEAALDFTLAIAELAAEAAELAAELAAGAAELAAGAAELALGMLIGLPASWQVFWTAAMVVAWSAEEQELCTQGWTLARSSEPFLQWQAKSPRLEHPSPPRGPRKQFKAQDGMSLS
jgi:hypothetical protein